MLTLTLSESLWDLLRSAAHWEFELLLMVVFDGIILGLCWPFLRKHWLHHLARDQQTNPSTLVDGVGAQAAKHLLPSNMSMPAHPWTWTGTNDNFASWTMFSAMTCKECGKPATYLTPDVEATERAGGANYVIGYYCDEHGQLPLIKTEKKL
jgi:hypothetical protein